ncbi:MAG TPA: cbb3-type cytochrome c oxidase subunit I [Candidatus Acidoferrum sp.]|jgi:cytochrome c oxidase cbb3-type subunit 1|nr:cbb3-type cytochrome c oxidase subunit I [Candidatus Acidoferrum sp.]
MAEVSSTQSTATGAPSAGSVIASAEIDLSCRVPLLILFLSAAVWLLVGSALALVASIKFHSPDFLAEQAWLTYGRVRPAYLNSVLYGFCVQAGLGVALWVLARLGRTLLAQPWLVILGGVLWNLGVTIGVAEILAGNTTGFENLEMPSHAAVIIFLGYLLLGIAGVLTFHRRRGRELFASQWFLFAALFWFAWIYSTANLLLLTFPARGVAQAVLTWWYSDNLQVVWLSLAGLAAVFYFVPKLAGRELHSHYLALFTFWFLVMFASWSGIPGTAPVPAWMPTVSTIATAFLILPVIAVALNVYRTMGRLIVVASGNPALSFVLVGVTAFVIAGLMQAGLALLDARQILHFTWFTTARSQLQFYGFFSMVMFGAIYHILPQLMRTEFASAKLLRVHLWLALVGTVLMVVPWAVGGIVQGIELQDPKVVFINIMKGSLPFLRVSTIGDLLLLLGHAVFLCNLIGLVVRFYRARAAAAYAAVTADLFKAAEAKT